MPGFQLDTLILCSRYKSSLSLSYLKFLKWLKCTYFIALLRLSYRGCTVLKYRSCPIRSLSAYSSDREATWLAGSTGNRRFGCSSEICDQLRLWWECGSGFGWSSNGRKGITRVGMGSGLGKEHGKGRKSSNDRERTGESDAHLPSQKKRTSYFGKGRVQPWT